MSWKKIIFILIFILFFTIYTGYKLGYWLVDNAPSSSLVNIKHQNKSLLDANGNLYIQSPPQPLNEGSFINNIKNKKNNINTLDLLN
ncbi:hypothetical protein CKSOR_00010 [Candidatus Kinetoplastibacterium sorsogonicusi]|uniref:Uncharacterized protein n=1 Tax=Candidatus Kinetoplastidibacterium kentomonadis TaxID=1576550 RepID=A0A3Q8EQQ9_9PROT|nr:hypothetical protein [Candidatus Kinetoplastibacterium sorsogonicusi]AWD32157.1 hypothetical protein CKSOR_00010 [Candidatus Kinetoplastibacterium sorsogonicusi]